MLQIQIVIEPFKDSHNGNVIRRNSWICWVHGKTYGNAVYYICKKHTTAVRFDELHFCKTSMLTQTSVWKVLVSLLTRYERYMHMQLIHKSNGCLLWHVHTYITCHAYVHINTRVCIIWNMDRNVNANFPQTL